MVTDQLATDTGRTSCASTPTASCLLPASLDAAAAARTFVDDVLCREHAGAAWAAARLVASEIATRAVLYGQPPFELTVACRTWDVQLTLTDRGTEDPAVDDPGDELRVLLLEKIARDSGVVVTSHGRTRWYDVPTGFVPGPRRRSWR